MQREELTFLPPDDLFAAVCQMLRDGYDAEFTVTGNSMWPFLAHGRDCVTLRGVGTAPLKKGDIVLVCTEQGYLLHRITRQKNGMVQTTGDRNCRRDGFVPAGNVLGRVVRFTRNGRQISCGNVFYRLCSRLWQGLFPIRPFLLGLLFRRRRRNT